MNAASTHGVPAAQSQYADVAAGMLTQVDAELETRLLKGVQAALACLQGENRINLPPYFSYTKAVHEEAFSAKNCVQLTYLWLLHVWGTRKYRKFVVDNSSDHERLQKFLALVDVILPAFIIGHMGGMTHDFFADPTMRSVWAGDSGTQVPSYTSVAQLVAAAKLYFVMS